MSGSQALARTQRIALNRHGREASSAGRLYAELAARGSCNSRGRPIESGCSFDTRVFRLLYSGLTNQRLDSAVSEEDHGTAVEGTLDPDAHAGADEDVENRKGDGEEYHCSGQVRDNGLESVEGLVGSSRQPVHRPRVPPVDRDGPEDEELRQLGLHRHRLVEGVEVGEADEVVEEEGAGYEGGDDGEREGGRAEVGGRIEEGEGAGHRDAPHHLHNLVVPIGDLVQANHEADPL
eukprot:CAMPEP_0116996382 /NCGR_PEP_ID=MMETSP0472-20121206/202_1 /TAXON_ID=693140 ORGANISM="Tiarina fusus, Strain LIS" /NCGR_SAMPLE_ID=MMETSP0472 /ASSEMBLY_ACC=CAM_ASM_000603 /LENGTH=234 /DNA_ID=CAMNT_0004694975 /DNA_START=309 /DNA_END=1014 /DNA_ORIENTATION=+